MALVGRTIYARGGRRIAVEDPGSGPGRAQLAATGLEPRAVPVDAKGLRAEALGGLDVDLVLATPAHQFPTGVVLAPERRAALLDWATHADGLVLEDDYDAEYRYDRAPVGAVQGLAPERVVYAGSVSKTLAPALRLGWLVVPERLIAELARAKAEDDLGTPVLEQLALADFLERGQLDRHLRRTRLTYRRRRDALIEALARHLPDARPSGIAAGLHLVAHLPAGTDEGAVARRPRPRHWAPGPRRASPRPGAAGAPAGLRPDRRGGDRARGPGARGGGRLAAVSYDTVIWEQAGAVGRVTLNRPETLNAWTADLGRDLKRAITVDAADPSVRAVLVTGAGRGFSSGADLREGFHPADDGLPDVRKELHELYHPIIVGVRRLEKPVVAAVNGPAVGIGASLAFACDVLLAAESAFFGLAFVNIGLMPDGGSTLFVPAAVGKARAFEMALLGERVPARQALEWGLVNQVVADDRLMDEAGSLAERLAGGPTRSYASSKKALNRMLYPELEAQLDLEAELQHALARTRDFQEGVTAFVEKREPSFRGA
jgi:2-(1,2-epoxy-1,2-dihydrophenyl)acetyl-CoA isomerase